MQPRVRGCTGKTTGHALRDAPELRERRRRAAAPSTSAGRCSVTSTYSPGSQAEPAGGVEVRGTAARVATRVSIIVLPTKWMRSSLDAFARAGSRPPRRECSEQRSASSSATIRLISSGIVRSKLRRPASTCATGIAELAATSAAASVELTSPGTTTRSGALGLEHAARAAPYARGLLGVRARADAEQVVGLAARRARRGRPPTSRGRSAARCGRRRGAASGSRRRSAAITGAILTKFGRAPTT